MIDWLDPRHGERILDICSGTGTLSIMLGSQLAGKAEVVGVEISPAQLRVAGRKRKPEGVSFLRTDAQDIPFTDGSFNKAIIFGALHEMPREVRQNVLSEAHRLIKAAGRLVVMEHNKPESRWKASFYALLERFNPEYSTYRDLLRCGLASEIERAGFRIVRTQTHCWEFFQSILAEK
jgi:demethylmenaquinone methyltransferase/2-methoxy-6-polyprenyl-1,4-benzoquinol methylase